jgi:multiple sugar transport system substrate-binding protein
LGITLPTNLADFQAAAATAAAQGKYIADFTADETGYWLSAQTAAAGGSWYGVADGAWEVTVQSKAAATVADFWQKMLDDKTVLTHDRWADTYSKAMTDGQLIGNIAAAWEVAFALDAVDGTAYEGQWRVAQIPDFGAGAKTGPDGGSGVAVMKGCQYPAQAMEFNDWFNTQVDDLFSQGLVTAATKAPTKTPEKMTRQFGGQDIIPVLTTANKNMPQNFVYIPGMGSVVPQVVTAATDVVAGTKKVSEIFDAGQTASVTALKDLGLKSTEG